MADLLQPHHDIKVISSQQILFDLVVPESNSSERVEVELITQERNISLAYFKERRLLSTHSYFHLIII